ncbi:MAG TPA: ABC transporter permease [Gemmatimonadaceae bacterium]
MAAELRFHLESRIAETVAARMTPDDAGREARARFGDVDQITRSLRSLTREPESTVRRTAWRQSVGQDLRYALRQLLRAPRFTAIAVFTLALGIGANTAIFSVVYSVLLRPLPYAHADRLLRLRERNGPRDDQGMVVTFGNYAVWRDRARSFAALGAYAYGGFTLTGVGEPQAVPALRASADYWTALYIPPVLGRYYARDEDAPGAPPVVVLSQGLWASTFASDPRIVGRTITLSGVPYTVVGVAPAAYSLTPQAPAIWVPLAITPAQLAEHADHELSVVGRVRDGITAGAAVAELARIETALARDYPHGNFDGAIVATPLRDALVGPVRPLLVILLNAVGLVLLIACGNVMNLLLARGAVRQKEVAIRCALGAGRGRLIAQMLAESLLLAGAGAVAGLAIAALGVRVIVAASPPGVPRLYEAAIDGPVLVFTMLLAIACAVAFGLLPALRATRLDLQQTLRGGGRTSTGAMRAGVRAALVIAEISLSVVLLVGAGLLVRSAIALQHESPGFDPRNLLVLGTRLPPARYGSDTAIVAAYGQIAAIVRAVPGVQSAALVSRIPIGDGGYDCPAYAEGTAPGDNTGVDANFRSATGNYFATIADPLLRGRTFLSTDVAGSVPVVVINRGLAHRLFGDTDPLGKRITHCSGGPGERTVWHEVVGVTGDMRANGLADQPPNEVYYPAAQVAEARMTIVVRGAVPAATLAPAIRRAVSSIDSQLAVSGVATMDEIIGQSLAVPRFATMLLVLLGATGLVLATVGIYGLIAYFVSQRAHEIGVRLALGASGRRVLAMVVRQGLVLAIAGVGLGLVVALAATRVLSSLLYAVGARDPFTFVTVAALLLLVAIAAAAIPARRAAQLDPLDALRSS